MKKTIIYIILGMTFLTTTFFVGSPFEFLNETIDKISTLLFLTFVVVLFILLFRQARRIEKKGLKRTLVGLLIIISIPYFFIGLYTFMLDSGKYHSMWKDITIYTNKDGEKVIRQRINSAFTHYYYRDRRIIRDFGQFRISVDCETTNLKGNWSEYDVENRTTKTINFENENLKNNNDTIKP